jgi:very-short-patch-repair endonuclease
MPHAKVTDRQRARAKRLREAMTPAETLLWRYIKAHRIDGLGFRRQVPIGRYIVDFVCFSKSIIVELDGSSHDDEISQTKDSTRDAFLRSDGFTVLRFQNADVMANLQGVVDVIRQASTLATRCDQHEKSAP